MVEFTEELTGTVGGQRALIDTLQQETKHFRPELERRIADNVREEAE